MNLNRPQRGSGTRWIILLIVVAGFLLFIDNNGSLVNPLSRAENPLSNLMARFSGLNDLLQRPADMATAVAEIEALRTRVDLLERENEELRSVQGEYERLLALFEVTSNRPNQEPVIASVVGQGPNPLFRDLIIDRGSNDGIRVGMPVESARGLVGQVFATTPNSAQVALITDASSNIPVRLSQSRSVGVLTGGGVGGLMQLRWLDLEAQLFPNEVVLTAGLQGQTPEEAVANRFPSDVVVGRVVEVVRSDAELYQEAIVQAAVDFDSLETVFVIVNFEPVDISVFEEEE